MNRHATYPQAAAAPSHRYSGTSSAFSASANPNEDWTKISDLAERRRIQNRIAQRNYRKKLKKRLEDLERRAASSSASPEQRPAELNISSPPSREESVQLDGVSDAVDTQASAHRRTPSTPQQQMLAQQEDRGMFAHQYTRQLSTSPPPFSYSPYTMVDSPQSYNYPANTTYQSLASSISPELPSFPSYLSPLSTSGFSQTLPSLTQPIKHEYYGEEEISPFSMNYASLAGIEIPMHHAYHDVASAHTPPLSDSFDISNAGSPQEPSEAFPMTPISIPGTPPVHLLG